MSAVPDLHPGRGVARPFLATTLGLVVGRIAALGTGFLFWLLAARAADPYAVGVAAGAVSLMMLGTQFAITGTGSAFILNHGRVGERRQQLLDAAVTIVLVASVGVSAVTLLLVARLSDGLRPVALHPGFAALFVSMTVLGTLGVLLDHVSVALERSRDVVVRNVASGLLTAAPLLAAFAMDRSPGPAVLFSLWVLGGVLSCGLGVRQLHRHLDGYVFRPRLPRALTGVVLRSGLPNQALTLVERAPNLLLPAIVTEVLSPELNAYWYVAWMMAWGVLIVPVSVGLTLFAQAAKDSHALVAAVVRAAKTGALLGVVAAIAAAVVGPFVLRLLGPDYAHYGTEPLRVLVLGVLPVLITQLYYGVCRARERVREAVAVGSINAVASVLGTAAVAGSSGLGGMARLWVAVQVVGAVWAGFRLRVLLRDSGRQSEVDAPGAVVRRSDLGASVPAQAASHAADTRARTAWRPRFLAWVPLLLGAGLWALPIGRIPLDRVSDLGVLTVLPLWCWLGLALVLGGTAWSIWSAPLREARVTAHVVTLVVLLYGSVVASSAYPRGTVSWRHVGIAAHIGVTGQVDPAIDAYFNWPGFFALLASWSGMSGLHDASALMRWAPVGNNLLFLVPLVLLGRALVPDRRRAWSGIVLFFLGNWVDQDYLAPQALGFFLYLCVIALVLTFFPAVDRLARRGLSSWSGDAAPDHGTTRALVTVVLAITAVVTAHQLTPFALLLGLAALGLLRSTSVRGLGGLTAVLIAAWLAYPASTYIGAHLDGLLAQVGDLAGAARGGIADRRQGSPGHLVVVRSRLAFSALIWALGAAGAVRMLSRRQLRAAAPGLLVAPALLFPLQSYGGEMLLRIFLFSLPFTALLAAQLLPTPDSVRSRRTGGVLLLVASLLLTPAFVLVRYGNQLVDQRGDAEVRAVRALYALAPAGSVLVAGNDNTPWRNQEYTDHRHVIVRNLGRGRANSGRDYLPPADVAAAAELLHGVLVASEPPGLVLFTQQQRTYERLLGTRLPWTLAELQQALVRRGDLEIAFRNPDAVILRPALFIGPVPRFVGPIPAGSTRPGRRGFAHIEDVVEGRP